MIWHFIFYEDLCIYRMVIINYLILNLLLKSDGSIIQAQRHC